MRQIIKVFKIADVNNGDFICHTATLMFAPESGSKMSLKRINASYLDLLKHRKSSNSGVCALWAFAFTLII